MEAAPDALVVVDACGRITLMNAQTERLFGYLRDELHGQSIETLIPQRFLIWPCAASHGLSRCPNNASDGQWPLQSDNGSLTIAIIRDATERQRIEDERTHLLAREQQARAETERAIAVRDQVLAAVSHG
jgi:PAS domain-containing protein